MTNFYIQPQSPRPDCRLVITFLWSDFHSVDTDGDSYNPASREWTELYCQNREQPEEIFDIDPISEQPLTLRISSEKCDLAARVAYFLAIGTRSRVATSEAGPWHAPEWMLDKVGAFDVDAALKRVEESRWQRATIENPHAE